MRQAGILAAGALFAINHHINRLAEDHENAVYLAKELSELPELNLEEPNPETNLVWFKLNNTSLSASDFVSILRDKGVLIHQSGPISMRVCTHLDASRTMIKTACNVIKEAVVKLSKN
jgi:threonine aldolase